MNNKNDFDEKMTELLKENNLPSLYKKSIVIRATIEELEFMIREELSNSNSHIDVKDIAFYIENESLRLGFLFSSYNIYPTVSFYSNDEPYSNMEIFTKLYFIKGNEFSGKITSTVNIESVDRNSMVEIVIE